MRKEERGNARKHGSMFGWRSTRGRAILTGLVVTLVLSTIAGVAVWRAHDMQQRHRSLERASAVVASLEHANARFYAGQAALATLVWRPDPTLIKSYQETTAEVDQALSLARAQALARGQEERVAAIDNLAEQVTGLQVDMKATIPDILEAEPEQVVEVATAAMPGTWSATAAIGADLDRLVWAVQDDFQAERAAADRAADSTLWLLVSLSTVAFVAGGAALAMLVASVLRPLRSLQGSVKAIASGDLEARAAVSGPEELASLAQDFNEMVDARRRAEEALRESEDRFRRLSEATVEGIVIHDGAVVLDANHQAAAMLGYDISEMIGGDPSSFVAPESRDLVRQHIQSGYQEPYEVLGLRKDGTTFPLEGRGRAATHRGREARVVAVQDLTERKRAEKALRESEERYRFLAEHARDVIVSYRLLPEPHHEYVSPSAEAVTGYTPEEFYADPGLAVRITHPDDLPLFAEFLRSLKTWGERPLVLRRIRKDGTMIWTEERTSAVFDQAGDLVATIAVIRDISERIRSEEGLEKLRGEFLGMLSHELKTPLTAIKGSAATALGARIPLDGEGYRELFQIVDEQADRLRSLADDMLDMTRIEAGTLSVSPEPVDLRRVLDEARTIFLHSDGSRALDIRVLDGLPPVNADSRRVVQVIANLLNNAAQCSPPTAPIELLVEHDAVQAMVHVRDHGPGIPPDKLSHLFKKFSQLSGEKGRKHDGAGLGLAISRGIIESHGGRIWAESAGEGQGATFSFTLPLAADAPAAAETLTTGDGTVRRRGGKTRVLAIDDEPQVLRYLKRSLESAEHEALLTGDPAQVPKLVELEEPDVVLLDIRLPGTSGFDVLRDIRQFSTVPVIFLTASDRDEDVVRAFEMGADDYMKKPFSPSELLARIKVVLRRRAVDGAGDVHPPFVLGDLAIDFAERRVLVKEQPVNLSATEYKMLVELATYAGRVLTHEQILQHVWGPDYSGEIDLVRSFIRNLRRKLGDDARHPRFIFTEPQVGYRMPRPQ